MDSYTNAHNLLAKYGIDPDAVESGKEFARIAKSLPHDDAVKVIAAFKFLRGKEVWKTDSTNATIIKKNYTDINFFKKNIWELSGHENTELTVWMYGANVIKKINIVASFSVMPEVIKACKIYYPATEAVMISGKSRILFLIYANGISMKKPLRISNEPIRDIIGDRKFIIQLKSVLDKFKNNVSVNYKAWYNTKTGEVKQVENFGDALKNDPKAFGVKANAETTYLNMRLQAEHHGWACIGVEKNESNEVVASVMCMTTDQMKSALSKLHELRYSISAWDILKINTNDIGKKFVKDEISDFMKRIGVDVPRDESNVTWI